MWKKMAGRLFELQSRNGILEEKDRRLYEYAYGVLLGRVVIYLIIVILGIITGNWMEMIVFLLPFTVLRQYAGGIHLDLSLPLSYPDNVRFPDSIQVPP